MHKETFALFQPDLWQEQGLVTVPHEEHRPVTQSVRRKAEKWIIATTAAIALSAAIAGSSPARTSYLTAQAGVARRFVIAFEEGTATATVQGADIPANYWSVMAEEILKWPRLSVGQDVEDGPEPVL